MKERSGGDVCTRVVENINAFYENVSTLNRAADHERSLQEKILDIENRLDHTNTSISHELQDLLNSGDELEQTVSHLAKQQDSILVLAREKSDESLQFGKENGEILSEIACVRGVTQYTIWLRLIEKVNLDLTASLETKEKDQIIVAFKKLEDVSNALEKSKCKNLKTYLESTVKHWHDLLLDTYTASLEATLQLFKWPFIEKSNNETNGAEVEKIGKKEVETLQDSIEVLYRIQKLASGHTNVNLPMRILMKPLRKRFKYHFLKSKSTNNPCKPEWFISQLSSWAVNHRKFLADYVQPVYDTVGEPLLAVMEFGQGLVALATEKLGIDIPIVIGDDILLAHTIDEVIGFARDMSNSMQYCSSQPSVLEPLTSQAIFSRWLNMERKFAFEKVDTLFMEQGSSVWENEVGDILTPKAAESFLALLLSVTERYKFLPVANRLEFLRLQIDLIEDFRVRLVQLVRTEKNSPLSSNLCPIINTLDHLILVLGNWSETPFFLQLQFHELNPATSEDVDQSNIESTVFDESIEELKYLKEILIGEVVDSIYYTITAKSLKYRTETKWFSMSGSEQPVGPAFCDMLQALSFGLDTAKRRINSLAFQLLWKQLAGRLQAFILEEVILQNKFCMEGAQQLQLDIQTGFCAIFGEFTTSPKSYFRELLDVLQLLTCLPGPLILGYDGLQDTCPDGANNILSELGVRNLTRERALRVIGQRVDLAL